MSRGGREVCIIGGGASGLTAAIAAARCGAAVTVLEKNDRPGRKLLASGNGKCNLTNLHLDPGAYDTDSPQLLRKCLERFSAADTLRFFRDIGLEIHDRDGWVYPVTDQAGSVLQLLLMEAEGLHVRIKTQETVQAVTPVSAPDGRDPSASYTKWDIRTSGWTYHSDAVILACGSPASAVRGSSGDAARLADSLSLPYTSFLPALVPLKIKGRLPQKWSAVRVRGSVSLYIDGMLSGSDTGELQLTENGISGIPVFQISRAAVRAAEEGREVAAEISFLADYTEEEAAALLRHRKEKRPDRNLAQILTGLLPDRIITVITAATGKDWTPEKAARLITHFTVPIAGAASMRQAQICSGGILLGELTDNLESRKYPGLYICGEALNAAGPCGGYNLQWAWTSGWIAGSGAGSGAGAVTEAVAGDAQMSAAPPARACSSNLPGQDPAS